jgi:two-component system sensor histidine kinase RpfC
MAGQFLWIIPTADQLATLTLVSYYTLIRLILLITIGKPYHLTPNLHGALVIFDQAHLAVMSLYGLPIYFSLPLSGVLLFMTRSLGASYLYIAVPAAFFSIFFTLIESNDFLLDTTTAIAISLISVVVGSLNTIRLFTMKAVRTHCRTANCSLLQSEPQNSELNRQQNSHSLSPIAEKKELRILIISNNDKRLTSLSNHLKDWGYNYTTSRNCIQAFRHMLSRFQVDRFVPYTTLIVDQHGLNLDIISLARLIHDEPKLESMRLICFKAPSASHQQPQPLYQAGYAALLETPLNKSQLFSALHGEQRIHPDHTNIVSLLVRRATKKRTANQTTVLLADTASSARSKLGNALLQAGYKVIMADDGDQALDALEEQPVSLAIVNAKLSIMSGAQILKLHRYSTPYKQWVPFVFLSDESDANTLRLCRSIGVQAYFLKPLIVDNLLETIPTLLNQHQVKDTNVSHDHDSPCKNNMAHFDNTSLLDHMTLLRLEHLDSGIAFINDLFKTFEAEGTVILRSMRQAVDRNQFGRFRELAQVILDSAGQLGAFALYELNRNATKLRAYEFEYRGNEVLDEIEKTFNLTLEAYSRYLSQRAASLHKNSK